MQALRNMIGVRRMAIYFWQTSTFSLSFSDAALEAPLLKD